MTPRYVVMAGTVTVATFDSYAKALLFARGWPDATRIVERGGEHHRREWQVGHAS